ncbi:MAG: SRPBCC domain-containing protein [Acidimicrobiales bacterium]
MTEPETTTPKHPDIHKTVAVAVGLDEAFRVFVERPIEWVPPAHRFTRETQAMTIEARVGGRFYERAPDGTEVTRGTIVDWSPPARLVMTWRVGANWQPTDDDEHASLIEVDFTSQEPNTTRVEVTNSQLDRHGPFAAQLAAALAGPSPGETLARYAQVVARHNTTPGT